MTVGRGVVLVVDDVSALADATARALRSLGWRTMVAYGVAEGLRLAPGADVVVTDWDCGDGGGERLARECDRPVLVYSARPECALALELPVVPKPARAEVLDEALRAALARASF